jgi:hypothetical protein
LLEHHVRIAVTVLLVIHGLIHLIDPAKAFGWANIAQLRQPVSSPLGALWLLAAVLLCGSAVALLLHARWWWLSALAGIVLSQGLILTVWRDARVGTLANVVLAAPVALALLTARAGSLRSQFEQTARALLSVSIPPSRAAIVTDADIAALPPLVQAYLRRTGAVGKPRVHNVRLEFDAHMRDKASDPWMKATAVQYEFFSPPARLFFMEASRAGVPFSVLHRYTDDSATFQVRIAEVKQVTDAKGEEMTRSETVTLLNDIVVFAPAAALDLPITWQTTGPRAVVATFTNAGHTVSAELTFDAAGDLVGFVSNDRSAIGASGARRMPWSTPISDYRLVEGIRVGAHGEAVWVEPTGPWAYGRFQLTRLARNVREFTW